MLSQCYLLELLLSWTFLDIEAWRLDWCEARDDLEDVITAPVAATLSKKVFASFSIGMFLIRLVGPRGTLQVGQVRICLDRVFVKKYKNYSTNCPDL